MSNQIPDRHSITTGSFEKRLKSLEQEMLKIHTRNLKVELEKEWETSKCRRVLLVLLTFIITSLVFWMINIPNPWLHALIPTTAYFLSTLTLPFVQRRWLSQYSGNFKQQLFSCHQPDIETKVPQGSVDSDFDFDEKNSQPEAALNADKPGK